MSAALFIFFCLQSKKRKLNKASLKRKPPAVNEGGSDSNTDAANKVSAYSNVLLARYLKNKNGLMRDKRQNMDRT